MRSTIALLAAASAPIASALTTSQSGGAKIINYCSVDVNLQNVPAMGEGVENGQTTSKTLKANNQGDDSSYFTNWVQLEVAGGWSMKLTTNSDPNNIAQYEYTWQGDGNIWYDMSFVNGNDATFQPWQFVCPQAASPPTSGFYSYSTDDAAGMQAPVNPSATVTLLLCPAAATGGSTGSASSAPASSSSPAASPVATTPASSSPPATTFQTFTSSVAPNFAHAQRVTTSSAVPTATLEIGNEEGVEYITEYATQVVTAVVTETAHAKMKRHQHGHPHRR